MSQSESLFSYQGSSHAAYQHPDHIPVFSDELTPTPEQLAVCGDNMQCLYDYAQTGSVDIAMATVDITEKNTMDSKVLSEFVMG